MQKLRNYKIRAFVGNWKMNYLASSILDRSKPLCLIFYEIFSKSNKFSVKRHYLSKHSTSIENKFPINSKQQNNRETQELKLKQQRICLNCLMTENFSLSIKQLALF